jgi:polysaccharide pyruvyl transferase WcaK-like protein
MLLIRLASALGVPTILSGQTIGIFKDSISCRLARWGLKKASLIYLRDTVDSAKDLTALGLTGDWINSTIDDALFFQGATEEQVADLLQESDFDAKQPYLAVNVHYWGQKPADSRAIMTGMASALNRIHKSTGLQIVFVPMVQSDEAAIEEVRVLMNGPSAMPKHGYRPDLAVGLIQNAALCITMKHHPIIFAMAAAVPTISMTFDDYYHHKNYGAMRIFHQEDCLLKSDPEQLEQHLCDAAQKVFTEKSEISRVIAEVVETLRPMSGEVITKFLTEPK